MRMVTKVQKLGRIAIPSVYREMYDIQEGDIVELEILQVKHTNEKAIKVFEDTKRVKT